MLRCAAKKPLVLTAMSMPRATASSSVAGTDEKTAGESTPLLHSSEPTTVNASKLRSVEESNKLGNSNSIGTLQGILAVIIVTSLSLVGYSIFRHVDPAGNNVDPSILPRRHVLPKAELFKPFSVTDPRSLNFSGVIRPNDLPGPAFGSLRHMGLPLPTNSWSENLLYGETLTGPNNRVFQIPYVIDTAGPATGVRTHGSFVQATNNMVITIFEPQDGVTLSAVETINTIHQVVPYPAFGRLALTLEWHRSANDSDVLDKRDRIRSPIVRGSPYTTMEYTNLTPKLVVQRSLASPIIIDNDPSGPQLKCGEGIGVFSDNAVTVHRELKLVFDTSDMTWLVFVSRPTTFTCSSTPLPPPDPNAPPLPPGVLPTYPNGVAPSAHFELRATEPMSPAGVIRISMVNNCTNGLSPQHCGGSGGPYGAGLPRDNSEFEDLIRSHSELYPSGTQSILVTMCLNFCCCR